MLNRIIFAITIVLMASSVNAQKMQWASELLSFSSEFKYDKIPGQYLAKEVLGPPSCTPEFGLTPCAWTPAKQANEASEFVHVAFAEPIQVAQIVINQPSNPGAIFEIYLYDEEGKKFKVLQQMPNPQMPKDKAGRLFRHTMELTPYKVKSLRLQLMTDRVPGYNLIDAIGISSDKTPFEIKPETVEGAEDIAAPENIGEGVNTKGAELAPLISPDGKAIFFTRQNYHLNIGNPDAQDIWYAEKDSSGNFGVALNLGEPVNNAGNNSICSVSPDGQSIMVLNKYMPNGRTEKGISTSVRTPEGGWSFPVALEVEDYYNDNKYGEYSLAADGKTLLMAVMRKDGVGDKDLHVSFRKEDGTFSKPKNLGSTVNTAASEISPYLAADGKTLYFATSGFPGYGGPDMFVTRRLDSTWTNWTRPQNLGSKLNSKRFDAYYSIPAAGDFAYFTSYDNAIGESDIFRVALPQSAKPQPVVLIYGNVLNAKTKEPLGTAIQYESLESGEQLGLARSNPQTGAYSIVLPNGDIYGFLAALPGFLSVSENIDVKDITAYKEIRVDLYLTPIEKDAVIRLNNLFFDFNKFTLRSEARSELNRVVALLNKYPNMQIEIGGHTDDIGSDANNLVLSNNRAKSVVEYLTKNGVSAARLQAKGYGEAIPAANNKTDEGRALNRRIELKILKVE